jgi:hypothetical protein
VGTFRQTGRARLTGCFFFTGVPPKKLRVQNGTVFQVQILSTKLSHSAVRVQWPGPSMRAAPVQWPERRQCSVPAALSQVGPAAPRGPQATGGALGGDSWWQLSGHGVLGQGGSDGRATLGRVM